MPDNMEDSRRRKRNGLEIVVSKTVVNINSLPWDDRDTGK
jgi:hypothetical protein